MSQKTKVRFDENVTEIRTRDAGSKRNDGPLILLVDEAFQRIIVISLFILIQAWKVYDLVVINMSTDSHTITGSLSKVSFLVKYSLIEGIFLWFLPILNISYLTLSPLVTLLLTLLLNLFNIVLVSKLNVTLIFTFIGPYLSSLQGTKELTIGGDAISPTTIDMESHFKGKYTIQYLPDSLVKFNVFNTGKFCQKIEDKQSFQIPIEFNTTTDIGSLELQYTSPKNQVSYIQYKHSDIDKLLSKDYLHLKKYTGFVDDDYRVFYIEVPVREPGSYKISKIRDKKGISIRYVQNEFSFAYCPSASFVLPRGFHIDNNKVCVGSKLDDISMKLPLVSFVGVPPLTTKIRSTVNGAPQKVIETKIDLEELDPAKFNFTELFSHTITRNQLEQEILKHPDILQAPKSGSVEFQILEVKDALGNTKRYNPQSDSSDLRYSLDLLAKPSVRLIDMDPSRKLIVNGTKGISFAASKNIAEQLPLTAEITFIDDNSNFTHVFNDFDSLRRGIEISKPGTYRLRSVSGKFCQCEIKESDVKIEIVEPPSVHIEANPIVDKCVGMTGYNFNFDASGHPPFTVEYSVYQNTSSRLRPLPDQQGRTTRLLKSKPNSFDFTYKPPGEGSYVIIFKSIIDDNYHKSPILLDQNTHTYLTYFKQRSTVALSPGVKLYSTCKGESASIPLNLKGNFPFIVDYSIVESNSGKEVVSQKGIKIDSSEYHIDTNVIPLGGNFDIQITKAVDSIGCTAEYSNNKIRVVARSDVPEVSIDTKDHITYHKIVEGDFIEIPVTVKSSLGRTSSDEIEYMHYEEGSEKGTVHRVNGASPIRVNKPGIYKLSKFVNSRCQGSVAFDKEVHVSFHERPQLHIAVPDSILVGKSDDIDLNLISGCQSCKREVTMELSGTGPFIVDYEIRFPSGKNDFRTITIEKNSLTVKLPTEQSGVYKHRFLNVYDALYTKAKSTHYKYKLPTITYEVNEAPNIKLDEPVTLQVCEASLNSEIPELGNIPVNIIGAGPFSLNLTITGDNLLKPQKLTVTGVKGPGLDLNSVLTSSLKQGEYEIGISSITDANGCSRADLLTSFVISITPAPKIKKFHPQKNDYCVGDHVGYDLVGQPPFTLFYDFQGKHHKATTSNEFRRLAVKPGTINVSGLEDSSAGACMINIVKESREFEDLEIKIHALPSVEINQGGSTIRDIHEGDMTEMTFTFTGTPPFSVTYVRTLDPNSKAKRSKNSKVLKSSKKITETNTIKDIWEHDHTIKVGLEGTYEAIEIKDKHCMAKKEFDFE